jgi:hypothetical protein
MLAELCVPPGNGNTLFRQIPARFQNPNERQKAYFFSNPRATVPPRGFVGAWIEIGPTVNGTF